MQNQKGKEAILRGMSKFPGWYLYVPVRPCPHQIAWPGRLVFSLFFRLYFFNFFNRFLELFSTCPGGFLVQNSPFLPKNPPGGVLVQYGGFFGTSSLETIFKLFGGFLVNVCKILCLTSAILDCHCQSQLHHLHVHMGSGQGG